MDPGIGAPGGGDDVGAGPKFGQGGFNGPLNRGEVGLTLPPREGCAVVFDFQGIARHSARYREGGVGSSHLLSMAGVGCGLDFGLDRGVACGVGFGGSCGGACGGNCGDEGLCLLLASIAAGSARPGRFGFRVWAWGCCLGVAFG